MHSLLLTLAVGLAVAHCRSAHCAAIMSAKPVKVKVVKRTKRTRDAPLAAAVDVPAGLMPHGGASASPLAFSVRGEVVGGKRRATVLEVAKVGHAAGVCSVGRLRMQRDPCTRAPWITTPMQEVEGVQVQYRAGLTDNPETSTSWVQ